MGWNSRKKLSTVSSRSSLDGAAFAREGLGDRVIRVCSLRLLVDSVFAGASRGRAVSSSLPFDERREGGESGLNNDEEEEALREELLLL